jgi:hypothetical protein
MTRLVGAVLGLALLAAAGCAAPLAGSASPATTRPAVTTTTTPPKPTLPAAADGTDLSACADDVCEVQVTAPGPIHLPEGAGATLSIVSIGDNTVTLSFVPTGDGSFTVGCDATDPTACDGTQLTGGNAVVTGHATAKATANNVSVLVVAVVGGSAVLRISPAH